MKLVTAAQMRALEQAAVAAGVSLDHLMDEAGLAVAQEVWLTLGVVAGRRVLVLIGPGNNGGDGLVAARHLADWEADVVVYMTVDRAKDKNLDAVRERNVPVFVAGDDADYASLQQALDGAEMIVDGILGTGRSRPIEGVLAGVLTRVRATRERSLPPKLMAIDLPTGIDADSGRADPLALTADTTITFGVAKVGLYTLPGSEYAGKVQVIDIGIPKDAERAAETELLSTAWVRQRLPARPSGGNKGTFGKVLVVAGSREYAGAPRLSAEACYRAGAGLVTIACPASVQAVVAPALPEATYHLIDELNLHASKEIAGVAMDSAGVLLIGPGLGQRGEVPAAVLAILDGLPSDRRAVIDADAINALAKESDWSRHLTRTNILTPHPGEMARLLDSTVEAVQGDRLNVAVRAAAEWRQVVVLKGAHTIVAAPDGRAAVSPYANALLATAGTGDVLAGTIAGLLAQDMEPFEAAACGVYVHALAAEELGEDFAGRGMLASELLAAIPRAIRTILHGKASRSMPPGLGDLASFGGIGGGGGGMGGGGFEAPGFP